MTEAWRLEAEKFIAVKERYQKVGQLDTESFNPKTEHLAEWAQTDLPRAYAAVKSADMDALTIIVSDKSEELARLTREIHATLNAGGNVQGYSMGSPFRALTVLQHLWSQIHAGTSMAGRFKGYGTGGDVSFVVPVKGVEDHPEYGARQIRENGLRPQDLLIGFVEGGETPSVLGAVQEGSKITDRNVQFLYSNPDDQLYKIEDVAAVHDNQKVDRYSLAVGPMALQGSTRMQATTVKELLIGVALLAPSMDNCSMDHIKRFVDFMAGLDYASFVAFTEAETETYQKGEFTCRRAREFAVTVASDSTEWCPTFNVRPFDDKMSPTYLSVIGAHNHAEAWQFILGRKPETLDWVPGGISGLERFKGLDISEEGAAKRLARAPGPMHDFNIIKDCGAILFKFKGLEHRVSVNGLHPLFQHLLLKMILNTHSTLMMGRMGKYEENYMSFVNVTLNYKLIDRGVRIVQEKFRRDGLTSPDYDRIVYKLYEMAAASTGPDDPPVPKAFRALRAEMAP